MGEENNYYKQTRAHKQNPSVLCSLSHSRNYLSSVKLHVSPNQCFSSISVVKAPPKANSQSFRISIFYLNFSQTENVDRWFVIIVIGRLVVEIILAVRVCLLQKCPWILTVLTERDFKTDDGRGIFGYIDGCFGGYIINRSLYVELFLFQTLFIRIKIKIEN